MSMQTHIGLDGVTATGAGPAIPIDRQQLAEPIPLQIQGITNATVILEATLDDLQAVDEGTAVWDKVSGGDWSEDSCDSLICPFNFVRFNVLTYTSGTITARLAK